MKKYLIGLGVCSIFIISLLFIFKPYSATDSPMNVDVADYDVVVLELVGDESLQKLGYLSSGSEPIDLFPFDNDFDTLLEIYNETGCYDLIANKQYDYLAVDDYDETIHDFKLEDKVKYQQYGYFTRSLDGVGNYNPVYFETTTGSVIHVQLEDGTYRDYDELTDTDLTNVYYGIPTIVVHEDGTEETIYDYHLKELVDGSYNPETDSYSYIVDFLKDEIGEWIFVPAFKGRVYAYEVDGFKYKEDVKTGDFSKWLRLTDSRYDTGDDVKIRWTRSVVENTLIEETHLVSKDQWSGVVDDSLSTIFLSKRYDEVTLDDINQADLVYFNTDTDIDAFLSRLYTLQNLSEDSVEEDLMFGGSTPIVSSPHDLSLELCEALFNKLVAQEIVVVYDTNILSLSPTETLNPVDRLYVSSMLTYPVVAAKYDLFNNSVGKTLSELREELVTNLGVTTDLHLLGIDNYTLSNEYVCKHNILGFNTINTTKDFLVDFSVDFMELNKGTDEFYDITKLDDSLEFSFADGLNYLLFSQKTTSLNKDTINILEIQPCNSFYSDEYWFLRVSGIDPYYKGNVEVTKFQAKALNGYKGNIYSTFDIVFVGANYDLLAHETYSSIYDNNTVELEVGSTVQYSLLDCFSTNVDMSQIEISDLTVADETIATVSFNEVDKIFTVSGVVGGSTTASIKINGEELVLHIIVTDDYHLAVHSGEDLRIPLVYNFEPIDKTESGWYYSHMSSYLSGFNMKFDYLVYSVSSETLNLNVSNSVFGFYGTSTLRVASRPVYRMITNTGRTSTDSSQVHHATYTFYSVPERVSHLEVSKIPTVYNDTSMNGKLYTHIGDIYDVDSSNTNTNFSGLLYSSTPNGNAQIYKQEFVKVRFSGNDITELKMNELKDFADSGKLVIVDEHFFIDSESNDLDSEVFDTTSNMYKFLSSGVPIYNSATVVNFDYSVFLTNSFDIEFKSVPLAYIDMTNCLDKIDSGKQIIKLKNIREEYFQKSQYTFDEVGYNGFSYTDYKFYVSCPSGYKLTITQYNDSGSQVEAKTINNGSFSLRNDATKMTIVLGANDWAGTNWDTYKALFQSGAKFTVTADVNNPSTTAIDNLVIDSEDDVKTGRWNGLTSINPYNSNSCSLPNIIDISSTCSVSYKSLFYLKDNRLTYKFTIKQDSDYNGFYTLSLYSDIISDGHFDSNEKIHGVYITDSSGQVVAENRLKAGVEYTANKSLDDSFCGLIHWLFRVTRNDNSSYIKEYQGYSAMKYSNEKITINVLQLLPFDEATTFNMATDSEFRSLCNIVDDFNLNIVALSELDIVDTETGLLKEPLAESIDGVPLNFQDFDMLVIGFGDALDYVTNEDLLTNIDRFINSGKSVLFSHDTSSYNNSNDDSIRVGCYYINKYFRMVTGQDRYGVTLRSDAIDYSKLGTVDDSLLVMQENVMTSSAGMSRFSRYAQDCGFDRAELDGNYDYRALYGLTNGFILRATDESKYNYAIYNPDTVFYTSNLLTQTNTDNSSNAKCLNVGQISMYPYCIVDLPAIQTSHSQYYELNLEDESITVWYCLHNKKYNSNYSTSAPMLNYAYLNDLDASNTYYIYTKDNITYTGLGHSAGATTAEKQLYVNTLVMAYRPTANTPKVIVTNENAETINDVSYVYMDYDVTNPTELLDCEVTDGSYRLTFRIATTSIAYDIVNGIQFIDKKTGTPLSVQCYSMDTNTPLEITTIGDTTVFRLDNSTEFYVDIPISSLDAIYGSGFSAEEFNIPIELKLLTSYGVENTIVEALHNLRIIKRGLFNLH